MGVCMRYASSTEEAEDWLQDGFMKVFNSLHQYSFQGSLEGWVRRVIRNQALQNIRKSKTSTTLSLVGEDYLLEPVSIDKEISELSPFKAITLIQQLPKGCRAVFNLYVIENYKHKEIAKILDVTEGTSKSQLNRARKLLKEMLHEKGLYLAK